MTETQIAAQQLILKNLALCRFLVWRLQISRGYTSFEPHGSKVSMP